VVRSLICSTVLGTHPEIKVNNCPFVVFGVMWKVSSKPPARGRGSGPSMAALTVLPNGGDGRCHSFLAHNPLRLCGLVLYLLLELLA
jgi:hypothetical protein